MQFLSDHLKATMRNFTVDRCVMAGTAFLKWTLRIGVIAAIGVGILIVSAASWQVASEWKDGRKFTPPGELVDVGGYRLHMVRQGKKGPVVVLEAGLACNHMDWVHVQRELAKDTQVISYDRAGYGWSDRSALPRTSGNEVEELKKLLERSGVAGPYILVGHSFGGFNTRLFALRYPEKVAALVFVDSCHEDQNERLGEDPPVEGIEALTAWGNPEKAVWLTRLGLTRFFLPRTEVASDLKNSFPASIKEAYMAKIATRAFAEANAQETLLFDTSGNEIKREERSLADIPIVVLTAGSPPGPNAEEADREWVAMHKELLAKSTRSTHFYAEQSGHMIPWHQPTKVVEAVHEAIRLVNVTLAKLGP